MTAGGGAGGNDNGGVTGYGKGGTATGGDLNISGGNSGTSGQTGAPGVGGISMFGYPNFSQTAGGSIAQGVGYGVGASTTYGSAEGGGGGAYCKRSLSASDIGASQSMTVGAGGTNGFGSAGGRPGIIIVTEFL